MGVSENRATPKSSILIGVSIINHPFWGFSHYFWKHPYVQSWTVQVGNVHFGNRVFCPSMLSGIFMTRFHPPTSEQKKSNGTQPWHITRFGKVMFNNRRVSPTGEFWNIPLAHSTSCLCFGNPFILVFLKYLGYVPRVCWNFMKQKIIILILVRIGMRILDIAITIYTYISNIICHQIRSNVWECLIGELV